MKDKRLKKKDKRKKMGDERWERQEKLGGVGRCQVTRKNMAKVVLLIVVGGDWLEELSLISK